MQICVFTHGIKVINGDENIATLEIRGSTLQADSSTHVGRKSVTHDNLP